MRYFSSNVVGINNIKRFKVLDAKGIDIRGKSKQDVIMYL
jgi:hypothetical protein